MYLSEMRDSPFLYVGIFVCSFMCVYKCECEFVHKTYIYCCQQSQYISLKDLSKQTLPINIIIILIIMAMICQIDDIDVVSLFLCFSISLYRYFALSSNLANKVGMSRMVYSMKVINGERRDSMQPSFAFHSINSFILVFCLTWWLNSYQS